jgi:hypothetical protein
MLRLLTLSVGAPRQNFELPLNKVVDATAL